MQTKGKKEMCCDIPRQDSKRGATSARPSMATLRDADSLTDRGGVSWAGQETAAPLYPPLPRRYPLSIGDVAPSPLSLSLSTTKLCLCGCLSLNAPHRTVMAFRGAFPRGARTKSLSTSQEAAGPGQRANVVLSRVLSVSEGWLGPGV